MSTTEDIEPEIPDTGAVFTFGRSKFAENAPSKFWIKKDLILQISCGDEHTAVATASGRLFTFGGNEWGQLGLGHTANVLKPSCVKSLKPDRVLLVACGKAHTVAAMASGRLFAFGSNADGQLGVGKAVEATDTPVEVATAAMGGEEVAALAAGSAHSMALTRQSGRVFVWGNNTEGQLGLGSDAEETVAVPIVLDFEMRVGVISCGYYHSALVTEEGFLYTFGDGEGGRLGLQGLAEAEGGVDRPTRVALDEEITSVSCGGSHTVALTSTGRAFSFGLSSNGQLGLGTDSHEAHLPTPIDALAPYAIVLASCGENHTAVVSDRGHLFTFGDGRHGKLCLDVETITNHFRPAFSDRFRGFRVKSVHCGGCHTMVFASPVTGSEQVMTPDEGSTCNGSLQEVNVAARQRHRAESFGQAEKRLPPIKTLGRLSSSSLRLMEQPDPEEIVNLGSELVEVNGNVDTETNKDKEKEEADKESEDEEEESNGIPEEEEILEDNSKKRGKISRFFRGFGGKWKNEKTIEKPNEKEEEEEDDSTTEGENGDENAHENGEEDAGEDEKEKKQTKRVTFFSLRPRKMSEKEANNEDSESEIIKEKEQSIVEEKVKKEQEEKKKAKKTRSRTCSVL